MCWNSRLHFVILSRKKFTFLKRCLYIQISVIKTMIPNIIRQFLQIVTLYPALQIVSSAKSFLICFREDNSWKYCSTPSQSQLMHLIASKLCKKPNYSTRIFYDIYISRTRLKGLRFMAPVLSHICKSSAKY